MDAFTRQLFRFADAFLKLRDCPTYQMDTRPFRMIN